MSLSPADSGKFTCCKQACSERVQSNRWHLAFALCRHSNETRAPTANPPNSAQLWGTPYHSPKLHSHTTGPCRSVGMWWGTEDRQTDRQTHVTTIHFALSTTHAKCKNRVFHQTIFWILLHYLHSVLICILYTNEVNHCCYAFLWHILYACC